MTDVTTKQRNEAILNRYGVYGYGFSNNSNLDLMNLVVLAVSGIIIKIFFEENYTKLGNSGPASTTIWGYGLTAISLTLMVFMAIYLAQKNQKLKKKLLFELNGDESTFSFYLQQLSSGVIPVIFTLGLIIYIIVLNFIYFGRINSNNVSSSYSVYSFFSSMLIIIQLGIIIKYMFNILDNVKLGKIEEKDQEKDSLLKGISLILITINYIFVLILHIILAFFSTDG